MNVAVFSTKKWVEDSFSRNVPDTLSLSFFGSTLTEETARLAEGYDAVCVFVNDEVNERVVRTLHEIGVRFIALRCAGFNNVDLHATARYGIPVCRVPAYSPYAVAEHAMGLILSLNRKYHRAHARIREGNFSIDGLIGFDMHGKCVGVIGTGRIGRVFMDTISGFGVKILAYDMRPAPGVTNARYVDLQELYAEADIISLHCPLTRDTYHMIDEKAVDAMKPGVMIINTSRGPLIDSEAIIRGLKSGRIGYVGLDVYEEEGDLFFEDLSNEVIQDDVFVRLQTFPNVLITAHQAFFTREAVDKIRDITFDNLVKLANGEQCENLVTEERSA